MPNENVLKGFCCPKCGSSSSFNIDVVMTLRVFDDGTEMICGDLEWDDESPCSCPRCSRTGTVGNFQVQIGEEGDDSTG